MKKEDLRIVYMGTPEFAVESLRMLVETGYNIVGVVTMPDKPAGRGHKLRYSAVKEYALLKNLPLLQPEKLKDETFLKLLKAWQADLQIVVAFRMLPEVVWNMPPLGTFNLHASLLPQYRGAAPINWAIINGETRTGATTFFLTHEIDMGKIIRQVEVPVGESDTAGIIHDELMKKGAKLVVETVNLILTGKTDAIPQEQLAVTGGELKAAPKIFKDTCRIDWSQPATNIYNLIRGLSPSPTAWTELIVQDTEPLPVKIYAAGKTYAGRRLPSGAIHTDGKTFLNIACEDGFICVNELQLPGKKRMKTDELLRGFKMNEQSYFI
ncbi:MAG: methionyl-tRNA formyltransferase [Prevotella sp.]|jgi:methionyl-tRNA formyltransferase|nr:methionyl-tRNA formyltransferase [Prevotella sp.]